MSSGVENNGGGVSANEAAAPSEAEESEKGVIAAADELDSGRVLADEVELAGQIDGGQSLSEPDSAVGASPNQEPLELPRFENELSDGNYRWSQLLARDAIFPIYDPEFAPAAEAPYADDELVIGVALNGEAKAYAIGPLNGREMVNDTLGGVPILVTW